MYIKNIVCKEMNSILYQGVENISSAFEHCEHLSPTWKKFPVVLRAYGRIYGNNQVILNLVLRDVMGVSAAFTPVTSCSLFFNTLSCCICFNF